MTDLTKLVSPLEWAEHGDARRAGDYAVSPAYGQGPKKLLMARGSKIIGWHDDPEAAKAAAQADHAARIIAAVPGLAQIVEAFLIVTRGTAESEIYCTCDVHDANIQCAWCSSKIRAALALLEG